MGVDIVGGEGTSSGGEFGASHSNQWGLCYIDVRQRRALPKLLSGGLVVVCVTRDVCSATEQQFHRQSEAKMNVTVHAVC